MKDDPHHRPYQWHEPFPDLRPEVYGREQRPLCGAVYVGADPFGLGPSRCMVVGDHTSHDDAHGRRWTTRRSVTITVIPGR